jgi:hypothetical protein
MNKEESERYNEQHYGTSSLASSPDPHSIKETFGLFIEGCEFAINFNLPDFMEKNLGVYRE